MDPRYCSIQQVKLEEHMFEIKIYFCSVDEKFNSPSNINVVVQHTGDIIYVSPRTFKSICSVNITLLGIVSVFYS